MSRSWKDRKDGVSLAGEGSGGKGDAATVLQNGVERRRRDGTVNKMSFDVDELEEDLYAEVEDDDEDVEEEVVQLPAKEHDVEAETVQKEITADEVVMAENDEKENEKLETQVTDDDDDTTGEFKIRPDLTEKFRPGLVQVLIERVIKDKLEGKKYSGDDCEMWVQQILKEIHDQVKGEKYQRYKLISQVTLGERQGEGVSSATRCLWDAEADCMATYTFLNDTIFCNGTVYGIYYY